MSFDANLLSENESLAQKFRKIMLDEAERLKKEALSMCKVALEIYEMGEEGIAKLVLREATDLARNYGSIKEKVVGDNEYSAPMPNELLFVVRTVADMVEEGEDAKIIKEFLEDYV